MLLLNFDPLFLVSPLGHIILRFWLKGKKKTFFFISFPFRIQLFLCIIGRRRRIFSFCCILLIADLAAALFNCLCTSNYSESETIPSTATCIWITGVLSSFEKSQEAKKGDSHTGLSLEKSSVDTINHYTNLGRKENIGQKISYHWE